MPQIVHLFTYPGQLSFWFSSMTVGNHHRLQVPNLTPILCTLKTSLSTLQPYKKIKNKNKGGCVFTLSHIGPLSNHINFFFFIVHSCSFFPVAVSFYLFSPLISISSGLVWAHYNGFSPSSLWPETGTWPRKVMQRTPLGWYTNTGSRRVFSLRLKCE